MGPLKAIGVFLTQRVQKNLRKLSFSGEAFSKDIQPFTGQKAFLGPKRPLLG